MGQHKGGTRSPGDINAIRSPLVADYTNTIAIGQGIADGYRLALSQSSRNGYGSGGGVINVDHVCRGIAGNTLHRTVAICVRNGYRDSFAHLGLRQHKGGTRSPGDNRTIPPPLIAEGTQTIGICQCAGCNDGLSLSWIPRNGNRSGGGVINVGHDCRGIAGNAFCRTMAVGVRGSHCDDRTHLGFCQQEGETRSPWNIDAIRVPLVVDGTHTISIEKGIGKGQYLILDWIAIEGDRPGVDVVDIGHIRRGIAGNVFCRAMAIRIRNGYRHDFTHLGFCQHESGTCSAKNVDAIRLPLVIESTQTIDIEKGIGDGEGLSLGCDTGNDDRTDGDIVSIGNTSGSAAGNALCRAVAIRVGNGYRHDFAHIGFCQHESGTCSAKNVDAIRLPLVIESTQTIDIEKGIGDGEGLSLGCDTGNDDRTDGDIVPIGNTNGSDAGNALSRTMAIGIRGEYRNRLAHFGFCQHKSGTRCASDGDTIRLPLVIESTQTIGIEKGIGDGENLAFGGNSKDQDRTRGGIVDICYNACRSAGHLFLIIKKGIEIRSGNGNFLADFSFGQE